MIRILCDSVASSNFKKLEDKGVDIISLSVNRDGKSELETSMSLDDFNERLESYHDNIPTSSQPSGVLFDEYFENAAKAGDSVVGIFLSSRLSSTFDCAYQSAVNTKKRYSSFECFLIDSTSACGPQCFSILDAIELKNSGANAFDVARCAAKAVEKTRIMFVPQDLKFLISGGRLNSVAGLLAGKLKIFPIITTVDGKACAMQKVRTKKKALDEMIEIAKKDASLHEMKRIVVHFAGILNEEYQKFAQNVKSQFDLDCDVVSVSPVISVHAGPAIGIAYECKEKIEGKFKNDAPQIFYSI